MTKARIAVIGCGNWAVEAHLPGLASDPRAEVVGLADPVASNLGYAAQRFSVRHTFSDARRLLQATQPDGVVVATPPVSHAEVGMLALDAGAHLLVEKPMVITPQSGRALIQAANEANREIIVGHPWHYSAQALALRARLGGDVIGEIQAVACVFGSSVLNYYSGDTDSDRPAEGYAIAARPETYSDPVVSGGGQGQVQLSHAVALLLFLTGLTPTRVSAFTRSLGLDVDVIDAVSVAFAGGALGTFMTTGGVPPGLPRPAELRLFGGSGYVAWDFRSGHATVVSTRGRPEVLTSPDPYSCYPRYAPVRNLVEVVLGLAPSGSPPDIGLRTASFLAAMYQSAAQNGTACEVED